MATNFVTSIIAFSIKMQIEVWKDAVNFENYFKVSTLGRILSKRTGRILKLYTKKDRRVVFTTRLHGRNSPAICLKVHRLVAEAFIPNPENKPQVNHIDCNPSNNHVENLEWATGSENMKHAFANGIVNLNFGSKHNFIKLSANAIAYIRTNTKIPNRKLASIFNVHHSTIWAIKNNITHKMENDTGRPQSLP